jgi:hypothetical protein
VHGSRETALSSLVDILIALLDLLEAEGRALRRATTRLWWGLAFIVLAEALAAVGIGLCLWAVYQYVVFPLGPATAALLTGLLALLVAGGVVWLVQRLSR